MTDKPDKIDYSLPPRERMASMLDFYGRSQNSCMREIVRFYRECHDPSPITEAALVEMGFVAVGGELQLDIGGCFSIDCDASRTVFYLNANDEYSSRLSITTLGQLRHLLAGLGMESRCIDCG